MREGIKDKRVSFYKGIHLIDEDTAFKLRPFNQGHPF